MLLSSDEEGSPSSHTRPKTSSRPRSRERGFPRARHSPAKPASTAVTSSTPHRDTKPATPRQKNELSVVTSPQLGAINYNLRQTTSSQQHDHVAVTSPQTDSTPHDLRRHVLNQEKYHRVAVTSPGMMSTPYDFRRATLHQQYHSITRPIFTTPLLSSDEDNELDLSAKPSKQLSRRQLRSSTKVPPPSQPVVAAKPAKTALVQKFPQVPAPAVTQRQTLQPKPAKKPETVVPCDSPGWMHLEWAEFFLVLVVVAFITLSLWLYQEKFKDGNATNN